MYGDVDAAACAEAAIALARKVSPLTSLRDRGGGRAGRQLAGSCALHTVRLLLTLHTARFDELDCEIVAWRRCSHLPCQALLRPEYPHN